MADFNEQIYEMEQYAQRFRESHPDITPEHVVVSKSGCSVGLYDPDQDKVLLIYSRSLGGNGHPIVYCPTTQPDGSVYALAIPKHMYIGFPDPPRPTPRFKAGDPVSIDGTQLVILRVIVDQSAYTRDWSIRCDAGHPDGRLVINASESQFCPA